VYRDAGGPSRYEAEEDYQGYIPGYTGIIPVYRDYNVNEGASSSLSNHVYPNPLVLRFKHRSNSG
jgi:hypothetical protein